MATTTAASTNLSMKLLVDTKAKRVLFAEASKDVVDFLFSLLALPVGTAVKLLGKDSMVGGVGNLYASVEKLDGTYVQPGMDKDALLHPTVLSPAASTNMFRLPEPSSGGQSKGFYKCSYGGCASYLTDTSGTRCPSCGRGGSMTTTMQFVSGSGQFFRCNYGCSSVMGTSRTTCPSCCRVGSMTTTIKFASGSGGQGPAQAAAGVSGKGFAQGIVTYTVMDNLTVNPMSSISSIALLNTFAVKDLGALEEKTVQLGYKEGLAILRASLQSKTVLTDVFLGKKLSVSGRA